MAAFRASFKKSPLLTDRLMQPIGRVTNKGLLYFIPIAVMTLGFFVSLITMATLNDRNLYNSYRYKVGEPAQCRTERDFFPCIVKSTGDDKNYSYEALYTDPTHNTPTVTTFSVANMRRD